MASLLIILDVSLGLVGLYIIRQIFSRSRTTPLPPGPTGWPIIGNLLNMPTEKEWLAFTKWGEKWGDLISISVLGQRMVIVNSARVAIDMLEKKGAIYSDRPVVQMGGEMVGWKNSAGLVPYGERLRDYRRLFYRSIGSDSSVSQFYPIEELEVRKFLKRLLLTPQDLAKHIRQTAGTIILHILYGYEVKDGDDDLVILADAGVQQLALSTAPGYFLVNLIPSLRFIPDWFPGTGFKRTAREWAATLEEMVERPYSYVQDQMAAGSTPPSFTANLLSEGEISPEKEYRIKWAAVSLYAGGADTTVSSIYAFFKAMALFPEVVAEAQAEIDSVIGSDRLPSFADRHDLPYINALVLEVFRWHTIVPIGVPHMVKEDDIHAGYLIPKGAFIISNIWKMQHDPKVYSDPMTFNPRRFLGPSPELDPRKICFGFGRRICPGRVLADASTFISCAMTLAVFDITKYVDDSGHVIEPDLGQTIGSISHPTLFQCSIKPRSQKALALIKAEI